jgi:hypothetical protein
VQIVRLHDPTRRPASWTEIIRPGQFAVFATDETTNLVCDLEGGRFADASAASCAVFDSLDEAREFSEHAVLRHSTVRYDVFDADGRTRPPLLTVLHPSRAGRRETSPRQMRSRRLAAWGLIAAGVPLCFYSYIEVREHDIIMPAFFGVNAILLGLRLLWVNLALRETEQARERRLRDISSHDGTAR